MRRMTLALVVVSLWMLPFASADPESSELSIKVKEVPLREKASHLGKVIQKLRFGDLVKVLSHPGRWYQVSHEADQGWLHESALTERKLVLKAGPGKGQTGASKSEMMAAYRPFDEEIELEHRKKNRSLEAAYQALDRLEARPPVTAEATAEFLAKGGLKKEEGEKP